MDNLIQYMSNNPLIFITALFITFLIVYFLFKQLFKIVLLFLIILIAIGGYYYFKDPKTAPHNIKHVLTEVKDKTVGVVDKGKKAYEKGKDLYGKAKDVNEDVNKFLRTDEKKTPEKTRP